MYKYLLFDLDGTLIKSERGIFNCIKYALDTEGLSCPNEKTLRYFIGPPLHFSFKNYLHLSDEQADLMVKKYRERYNDSGLFETDIYEGIPEILSALYDRGCELAVATGKPTEPALRILEYLDILKYFKIVVGSRPDRKGSEKKLIISEALDRLRESSGWTDAQRSVTAMVGDRCFDIEGGRACGIDTIGVLYGYGSLKELSSSGATHIVRKSEEIICF